jgi:hypothetical protein
VRERKKRRWTDWGLVKKEKQLDERKLSSFFAKPQKQISPFFLSSNTERFCSKKTHQPGKRKHWHEKKTRLARRDFEHKTGVQYLQ